MTNVPAAVDRDYRQLSTFMYGLVFFYFWLRANILVAGVGDQPCLRFPIDGGGGGGGTTNKMICGNLLRVAFIRQRRPL